MTFSRLLAAAAALGLLLSPMAAPAQEAPAASVAVHQDIRLADGPVRGAVEGGIARFQGVPFAAPPVGDLRWKPPAAPAKWTEVRDATRPATGCQKQEDCLYLNVTKPASAKKGAKLPVMVWIHGGAFAIGDSVGAFGAVTDGIEFAKKDVVLVSINYRLGRAGWFAHPALTREGLPTGNYGLMDQIQALKWVKANIAEFGGDPDNVTIFGESAGGISVLYLMLAPDAKGLFHKAIAQSGFARHEPTPRERMEAYAVEHVSKAGVTGDDAAAAAALRKLPLSVFPSGRLIGGAAGPAPILDGKLITGGIAQGFSAGRQMKIPLIIGGNSNEASLFRPQPAQLEAVTDKEGLRRAFGEAAADDSRLIHALVTAQMITEPDRNLARLHAKAGAPAWVYHFSYLKPEYGS
jgi:para-nitrobenzyl esterase